MIAICIVFSLASCNRYDDSVIWEELHSLDSRIKALEEKCDLMNQNIMTLQVLITALQQRDAITSVTTLENNTGYLITFSSGKEISIYNGVNGHDGTNGENGHDGHTPIISVRQDTDGEWYWTLDGEWLYSQGQKIRASAKDGINGVDGINGTDGLNGENGKDGITPRLKIEEGFWYISYDGEQTWIKLGAATGDSGLNGEDGDSFFSWSFY